MSLDQFRALASNVDLFEKIAPDDIARILAKGITEKAPKGSTIFHKGTTGSTMYVILAGCVELYDGQKLIATLRTGDMMGEMALISEEPRSATAIAKEDTRLFVLSETTFQRLMTKRVAIQILFNIVGALSKRLREANKKIVQYQADLER